MAGDELGRARPIDITPDRPAEADLDEAEGLPRPEVLPWTSLWALVSGGLLLFAWTGAGLIQEVLILSDDASGGFGRRSVGVTSTAPSLVLALLSGGAGLLSLRRPVDGERAWSRPVAAAAAMLAAVTTVVFLGLLLYVLARHQAPQQQ